MLPPKKKNLLHIDTRECFKDFAPPSIFSKEKNELLINTCRAVICLHFNNPTIQELRQCHRKNHLLTGRERWVRRNSAGIDASSGSNTAQEEMRNDLLLSLLCLYWLRKQAEAHL